MPHSRRPAERAMPRGRSLALCWVAIAFSPLAAGACKALTGSSVRSGVGESGGSGSGGGGGTRAGPANQPGQDGQPPGKATGTAETTGTTATTGTPGGTALARKGSTGAPRVDRYPAAGCMQNVLTVVTLPGGRLAGDFALAVVRGSGAQVGPTFDALVSQAQATSGGKKTFVAILNAGFFNEQTLAPVSFHQARTFSPGVGPGNSDRGRRHCGVYDKRAGVLRYERNTPDAQARWKGQDVDVFCAGPLLVKGGRGVAGVAGCEEEFLPAAQCVRIPGAPAGRSDGQDPLDAMNSKPRSASCVTTGGDVKFLSVGSPLWPCGATLLEWEKHLLTQGCADGLNHDGGASAGLATSVGGTRILSSAPAPLHRRVPIWVGVLQSR